MPDRALDLGGDASYSFVRKFKDTVSKIPKLCFEGQLVEMKLNLEVLDSESQASFLGKQQINIF